MFDFKFSLFLNLGVSSATDGSDGVLTRGYPVGFRDIPESVGPWCSPPSSSYFGILIGDENVFSQPKASP